MTPQRDDLVRSMPTAGWMKLCSFVPAPQRRSASAIAIMLLGCLSSTLLIYGHETYVYPVYGYMGLPYTPLSTYDYLQLMAIVSLPGLLLPRTLVRVSTFLIWIIYYFCFVPVVTMAAAMGILSYENVTALQISVALGFSAIALIPNLRLAPVKAVVFSGERLWVLFFGLYVVFNLWIVMQNASIMSLVSFGDVYVQRFAGSETEGSSAYAMGIASGVLNPFLMSYALFHRKRLFFALGALGQIVIYAVVAQKFVVLSLLYIPGFFFLMGGRRVLHAPLTIPLWRVGALVNVLLGTSIVIADMIEERNGSAAEQICDIVLMRLFALPGGIVTQYAEFFEHNPVTYATHNGFLKFFFEPPYMREVSVEIGSFLNGGEAGMNANANFFAYDGIVSFGLVGPIFAGVFVGLILLLLDRMAGEEEGPLLALTSTTFAFTLTDGSAYTALVSGGGLLLFLLVFLYRSTLNNSIASLSSSGGAQGGVHSSFSRLHWLRR